MQKSIFTFLCFLSIIYSMQAQLTSFTYPTATGQAFLSDKYDVYVKVGNGAEQKLQVLMSDVNYRTMYDGDWMKAENKDRTFSFVHVDYNKAAAGLTFRIVKKFGTNSTSAVISPKSYGYTATLTSGKELTFKMDDDQKYMSINFKGSDNESPTKGWIKNMLCVFVDPPETNKPSKTATGVVVYSKTTSASALSNATTIYFPAGYHNLREYTNGGLITADGQITIKSGQSLYLEGGAFVEGIVKRTAYGDVNQKIYGRGIITGRQYYWKNHPSFSGIEYGQLLELGNNAEVNGIMYMESPNHGLTGRNVHVKNVKFLGWHSNHDGIRVGEGSEIENSFLRAVDDHFYDFNIWVHDCVLWAGYNGSIMTYGWSGDAGANNYNAGASTMENIDIINCEWTSLGNNNGLIMSQRGYDYKPYGYGGATTTILRNIRIEGSIPGLTNLKPRSSGTINTAVQVPNAQVGYLGDLILENITVESQFGKGVIRGEADPSADGDASWLVQNVQFKNVSIGGVCVNESNKNQFFTIDGNTIKDLSFNCSSTPTPVLKDPVISFTAPVVSETIQNTYTLKVLAYDEDFGSTHGDGITSVFYQLFSTSDPSTALFQQNVSSMPFSFALNTKDYPNGDYELRAGVASSDFTGRKWTILKPIKINNQINQAPTVSLTSPQSQTTNYAPASLILNASATDDKGVTKVEFYRGTTLLATVNTAPYTYNWTNVASGTYTLKAKAYDAEGLFTTSSAITLTVETLITAVEPTSTIGINGPSCVEVEQAYTFTLKPEKQQLSKIAWWSNGGAIVTVDPSNPKTASVVFPKYLKGTTTSLFSGVNFDVNPWYKEYSTTLKVGGCPSKPSTSLRTEASPQPFDQETIISTLDDQIINTIVVYNTKGVEVDRIENINLSAYHLGENLGSGMYIVHVHAQDKISIVKLIKR